MCHLLVYNGSYNTNDWWNIIMLSDELYWKFISRFKNYYNGTNKFSENVHNRLCDKLDWLHSYICIFLRTQKHKCY